MKALLINSYNALAVKMVADNPCRARFGRFCWPLRSIRDAAAVFTPVWNRPAGMLGKKVKSLDDIETALRGMGDYRIHACIVCASVSCPDLRNEAFSSDPAVLEGQLTNQMNSFLNNTAKGLKLDRENKLLTLSPIFKWFQKDFIKEKGSVMNFILEFYDNTDGVAWLQEHKADIKLEYFSYNWDANDLLASTGNPNRK
eukprot:TRINITY_DN8471_c0_g1_i1.p1 TRINITY_DN8471_c0_g1~~TRINITY_DN8471_c0_g1_i1.p1  ORF type:complete len:199 (-),score=47.50 TRINITY_DN8471_c0_g1_i1:44-640(-)